MSIIFESHDNYLDIFNSITYYTDRNTHINIQTNKKLLVLDIDNTLLCCPDGFDHDVFYSWQLSEIVNNSNDNHNNNNSFFSDKERLLDFMYDMWLNVDYELCDDNINKILHKLKNEYNYDILFLTARHVISEDSLRKILNKTGLSELLTIDLIDDYIDKDNDVYHICGIIYTGGKNKGEVLKSHINMIENNWQKIKNMQLNEKQLNEKKLNIFNDIVFIDDSILNLHRMTNNMNKVKCILYTGSFVFDLNDEWKNNASNKYIDYVKKIVNSYDNKTIG